MQLYPYQKDALNLLKTKHKLLLNIFPGGGKTLISLLHAEYLINTNQIDSILVVGTAKKVGEWLDDIPNGKKGKASTIVDLLLHKENVVISYPSFSRINTTELNKVNWDRVFVILDESHRLAYRTSKQTKIWMWLGPKIKHMVLMTGTVLTTDWTTLYSQLKILGHNWSWQMFRDAYTTWKYVPDTHIEMILGYKNTDDLIKIAGDYSLFVSKEDGERAGVIVPNINEYTLSVPTSEAYTHFRKHGVLDNYKSHGAGTKLLGERMLTSGVFQNKTYNTYKKDLLSKVLSTKPKENWVIFYNFNVELGIIIDIGKELKYNIQEINGNNFTRDDNESKDKPTLLLIHYSSGAEALDGLQFNYSNILYFSPPMSQAKLIQSRNRIVRPGQTKKNVNIVYLVMEKSIDEEIYKTLEKQKTFTESLFRKRRK